MNTDDINTLFTYLLDSIIELTDKVTQLNERIESLEIVIDQLRKSDN